MPVLDTAALQPSLPQLRRAHLVLTFLLHFYVHTSPTSARPRSTPLAIPPSISIPLLKTSTLLGLPPVVTYSDTVLYNFLPLNPSAELSARSNPPSSCLASFTNTQSEEQFYVVSALCEIAGAEALRLMRQSLDELFLGDAVALKRLTVYLRKLAVLIDRIGDITLSMTQQVDPEEFYHLIRPWFRGGDSDGPNSAGWAYLGLDGTDDQQAAENPSDGPDRGDGMKGRLFSGPSAGQSSLIHAIDIFLTVDQSPQEEEEPNNLEPVPSASSSSSQPTITLDSHPVSKAATIRDAAVPALRPNEATFVQRMLQYMPLQHRTFLLHLSTHPTPLRPLIVAHAASHPRLAEAYDSALDALKRFREKHMRIASLFIVQHARRKPSERIRKLLGQDEAEGAEETSEVDVGELRGTGGSPLFKFLKRCRDNTSKAMVGKTAAPGFELA